MPNKASVEEISDREAAQYFTLDQDFIKFVTMLDIIIKVTQVLSSKVTHPS